MAKERGREDDRNDLEHFYSEYLQSVRTFAIPPPGFDPRRASARELVRYGFPARPTLKAHHDLTALWDKAFSRPIKPVKAEVEIDRVLLQRRRARQVHDGRFAPAKWGGIVALRSAFRFVRPEPINMVYGEWGVPAMEPDFDNPTTPMTVGFWVGIDGYVNNQVLQAGTAATVTGDKIDYWAWFEWYPAPPVRITNFPIDKGDLVTVLVCAPQSNQGYASMLNRTTGVTTNIGFSPPPGVSSSQGTSAEWVVEGISSDLPNFVAAGFHNCVAGTKNFRIDLSQPTEAEIQGVSGNRTVSLALLPDTVLVLWQAYR